eukprot:jgi/Chlat1/6061/Chrsp4S06338
MAMMAAAAVLAVPAALTSSGREGALRRSWRPQAHLARRSLAVRASIPQASEEVVSQEISSASRREVLALAAAALAASTFAGEAFAAKGPKGYNVWRDAQDGYQFLYPFGWQEVAVKGQDVAFKDVIEPLESVSVNIIATKTDNIEDLGAPDKVAATLVDQVLTSSNQKAKLLKANERSLNGKQYYTFEFESKAPSFTRHAISTVTINNGKFYTITTGANSRRWDKMEEKLKTIVNSFELL